MSTELDKNLSTVLAVAVASIIQVAVSEGPFTLWNVMIGVVLISVLLTYRSATKVSIYELAALATVWGLTIVITTGVFVQWLFPQLPRTENGEVRPRYFFYLWLIVSSIVFAIVSLLNGKKIPRGSEA